MVCCNISGIFNIRGGGFNIRGRGFHSKFRGLRSVRSVVGGVMTMGWIESLNSKAVGFLGFNLRFRDRLEFHRLLLPLHHEGRIDSATCEHEASPESKQRVLQLTATRIKGQTVVCCAWSLLNQDVYTMTLHLRAPINKGIQRRTCRI